MGTMVGTIININKYLGTEEAYLFKDGFDEKVQNTYALKKDRMYIIPDYQREIRWEKENVIELMSDINSGPKFLGNIILSYIGGQNYNIIDGQQRTTIIMMLLQCINSKYEKQIKVKPFYNYKNESFDEFIDFLKSDCDLNKLDEKIKKKIKESDNYNQINQIIEIWDCISNSEYLETRYKAKEFLQNLNSSQVNIIVNSSSEDVGDSISYFLDVNLKGVKLDNEDIFKGYLFSIDASEDMKNRWKTFKKKCIQLNESLKYPTMDILNHYFHCQLYKYDDGKYKSMQYSDKFILTSDLKIENIVFHKGQHFLKVINDYGYINDCFDELNQYLDIILDISKSTSSTNSFNSLFPNTDNEERQSIFALMSTILKDSEIIPKVLLMKYFLNEVLSNASGKASKKIYPVFMMYVIFSTFSSRKGFNEFSKIVGSDEWYNLLIDKLKEYLRTESKIKIKNTVAIKYFDEVIEDEKYRCKALACVYNFFGFNNNNFKKINKNKLHQYLYDNDTYSIEHFLINESNTYHYLKDKEEEEDEEQNLKAQEEGEKEKQENEGNEMINYPKEAGKVKKLIYNFLFIPKKINGKIGNELFVDKIAILKNENLDCDYSKMVLDTVESIFNESYRDYYQNKDMDSFFEDKYSEFYDKCCKQISEKIINKLRGE